MGITEHARTILLLGSFSRTISIRFFSLGPWPVVSDSWPFKHYLALVQFCGVDIKYSQIAVGYSHKFGATTLSIYHASRSPLKTEGFVAGLSFSFLLW